jgi:hypothetical protein
MARPKTIKRHNGTDAAWLALLAMLCQLLAPALYASHHAAMAQQLAQASGAHWDHQGGDQPASDPSTCLVHMALHAAASGAAPPPPAIPLRLSSSLVAVPAALCIAVVADQRWRPQASRAPPRSSDLLQA